MEINYDVPPRRTAAPPRRTAPPRLPTLMQKPAGQKHMDFEPLEVKKNQAGGR